MQEVDEQTGLNFPSGKKIPTTQAPIYAGLLVSGMIMGVLITTAWSSLGGVGETSGAATSTVQTADAASSTPAASNTTPTEAPLMVDDQPAGPSVAIAHLNIARPVWVVVYVSREGKPGNALGARLFSAADKQGRVGLLRDTERGQSYFVGLSVDNGDRAFSLSKDKPLADADGGPLWATFRAL
ncbi:MAG: hypothetical protein KA066_00015 [Candidatus Pacebacteria bacterium]|nr:hypothetical protein [Candidatus Paceibacterota bacterium]